MEKILARRLKDKHGEGSDSSSSDDYLYLVKWKNLSYIHCDWITEEKVLSQSQGKGRLQRFVRKDEMAAYQREGNEDVEEDEPIPEDFVSVDRILAERTIRERIMFYVKWRALSYAEGTWEYADDIKDDQKVEEFRKRNEMPSSEEELLRPPKRPELSSFEKLPMPTFKNGGELREYQMEGYNWLISCWFGRQGSILADEMGLGKTIQSVSFCNYLFSDRNIRGPFLVIAPLSTLGHWNREFETWTFMNAIVYHGNSDSRRIIQEYEWAYPKQSKKRGPPYKWDVLITTYETILQESSKLRTVDWEAIVIDEAHKIKNRSSKLVSELNNFRSEHRILLTGTPIQNNPLEVWALLHYIDPVKFASQEDFSNEFGEVKDAETVDKLKDLMRPYLLRRLKEDVEKSIPPKEETIVSVELTRIQKKWYRAMLEQNFSFLDQGSKQAKNVGNLRNIVMELRKCCNHPYLIKEVEHIETEGLDEEAQMKNLIEASGKLVLVDKLLPRLKENGHKVLIFSQMIRVLDIVEDYLVQKRWGYERIDGRVRGNDRQQAIDRFSKKDSDKFVFLLCTRAGGQGINLTVADTVIIYDSDWNPQNDIQAQARCHRIGQKSDVKVYRLITRGTYEQDMFDRASKKLGLDHAVLQNMGVETETNKKNQNVLAEMKKEDIDSLLKKGAYDVFNEDDSAADAFSAEDIDHILARRTTLLQTGATNAGPSAFSKANFAAETNKGVENVELDDPDFWKKLMPAAASGPDPALELRPRLRRQTQRFAPGEDSSDEDLDDGSGDEMYAGEAPSGKKLWNKSERQRAQRGLMTLGWGQWRALHRFSNLEERRSMDEVAYFCRRLVRLAVETIMANKTNDDVTMEYLTHRFSYLSEVFQPHRAVQSDPEPEGSDGSVGNANDAYTFGDEVAEPMFTEPVLENPDFKEYLVRNANHLIERLDLLHEISLLGKSGALRSDSEMPFVGASGSQVIGSWWNTQCDRDLLLGTMKHGYGNYRPMRADPSLIFKSIIPLGDEDEEESAEVPASQPTNNRDNENVPMEVAKPGDTEGSKQSGVDEQEDPKDADEDAKEPNNGTIGTEEMEVDADKPAENGHRDSLEGNKECKSPSSRENDQSAEAIRRWPPVQVLNTRVKKLTKGFQRLRRKQEKVAKMEEEAEKQRLAKEQKRREKEAEDEERRAEKERKLKASQRIWSKKEKADFAKYIANVGDAPLNDVGNSSWALVQERAGLSKKAPELIGEYMEDFHDMCRVILFEDENPGKTWDGRKYSEQEREDAKATLPNAKRFFERKHLLRSIRDFVATGLENTEISESIKRVPKPVKKEGLPKWWQEDTEVYDKALLTGVAKHGFDPSMLATDEKLPFWRKCGEVAVDYYQDMQENPDAPENPAYDAEIAKNNPQKPEDIPKNDLINFFARDRAVFIRSAHLHEAIVTNEKDRVESKASKKKKVQQRTESKANADVGRPEYYRLGGVGVLAGHAQVGFQTVARDKLSRRILKVLKGLKKSGADNQVFEGHVEWTAAQL